MFELFDTYSWSVRTLFQVTWQTPRVCNDVQFSTDVLYTYEMIREGGGNAQGLNYEFNNRFFFRKILIFEKNKSLPRARDFYFNLSAKNCVHVITVDIVVANPRICNAFSQTSRVICVSVNNDAPKNKTKETITEMIIQLIA